MQIKITRAIAASNIHGNPETISRIMREIPEELIEGVSSKQLTMVINMLHKAHKQEQHKQYLREIRLLGHSPPDNYNLAA